jgi:hypothetical protein
MEAAERAVVYCRVRPRTRVPLVVLRSFCRQDLVWKCGVSRSRQLMYASSLVVNL